jgi:hypothetical protein
VAHMLAMAFDDPSMDADLRATLATHEIMLGRSGPTAGLGVVCATEGDGGLDDGHRPGSRPKMSRKIAVASGQFTTPEVFGIVNQGGNRCISLAAEGCPAAAGKPTSVSHPGNGPNHAASALRFRPAPAQRLRPQADGWGRGGACRNMPGLGMNVPLKTVIKNNS